VSKHVSGSDGSRILSLKVVGYNKNCYSSEVLFPGSPAFVTVSGWMFLHKVLCYH